ncbi:MFS transporter [Muriicola soli]|uniref:MFS transporter n=1 Tax=Muriicola soli TaxID=2507538 RepID=A0A411E7R0_9FLAO|nr:MFS transporter [Muriicola soli]QBA63719.1 MFS transporter [Muriicola soli]
MQKKYFLPIIVVPQFFCTSLWFAGNGVLDELISDFNLNSQALGHLTSAVQFGFILGTLVYATLMIADRYSPSKVFFFSSLLAAIFNLGMLWEGNSLFSLLGSRFLTGFFLAGIYPVGMKIAADYFKEGLGKSLSFLVGALVLGTALPHLLAGSTLFAQWKWVIITTSLLAMTGGIIIVWCVPDGPFRRPAQQMKLLRAFTIFKNVKLRKAAIGYFGHMWELYAFWAFVPVMILTFNDSHGVVLSTSLWSFIIIGIGSLGCVIGGITSERLGVKKTASGSLLISCICCLSSPVFFYQPSEIVFLLFLMLWGMAVIADSPLFSTLVAQYAEGPLKGSALTLVNCIGFAITIFSIQILNTLQSSFSNTWIYVVLAIGPAIGIRVLFRK